MVIDYKITNYHYTGEVENFINVVDREGGEVPYKVTTKLLSVGTGGMFYDSIGKGFLTYNTDGPRWQVGLVVREPRAFLAITSNIKAVQSGAIYYDAIYANTSSKVLLGGSVPGAFSRTITISGGINDFIGNIGFIGVEIATGYGFQAKIERVSDGAGITKTDKETIRIPFLLSWSNYEEPE